MSGGKLMGVSPTYACVECGRFVHAADCRLLSNVTNLSEQEYARFETRARQALTLYGLKVDDGHAQALVTVVTRQLCEAYAEGKTAVQRWLPEPTSTMTDG